MMMKNATMAIVSLVTSLVIAAPIDGADAKRSSRAKSSKARPARAKAASSSSTYYANCAAARAAGAAPVSRGDPGYSRKLDRDNDGVGCE